MKDIKTLYREIRYGPRNPDIINQYKEAIAEVLESPSDYLLQLEYIISSSYGLPTMETFMEKYSMPLAGYRQLEIVTESLIDKGEEKKIDVSHYVRLNEIAKDYLDKHQYMLAMFEAFENDLPKNYFSAYYNEISKINNNFNGAINKYGPGIVPDLLLSSVSNQDKIIESAINNIIFNEPENRQWLLEATKEISIDRSSDNIKFLEDTSMEGIVSSLKNRRTSLIRESAIMRIDDVEMEYEYAEVEALENYIRFQEYLITAVRTSDEIYNINEAIFENADEHEIIMPEGESVSDVVQMLPHSKNKMKKLEERAGTRAQQKGRIPLYLSRNHDMKYGEDEDDHDGNPEDYKRTKTTNVDDDYDYGTPTLSELKDDIQQAKTPEEKQQAVNNYYYYTYTNSFNKQDQSVKTTDNSIKNDSSINTNSRNDSSINTKTDNSVTTKNKTDQSINKRTGSTDNNNAKKESFDIEMFIKESMQDDTSLDYAQIYIEAMDAITEAEAAVAGSTNVSTMRTGMWEKLKDACRKILDFLINAYHKLFPKSLSDFKKLEEKFQKSKAIQEYLEEKEYILPILRLELPSQENIFKAIYDLNEYVSNGTLPTTFNKSTKGKTNKIMIYYGYYIISTESRYEPGNSIGFKILSSEGIDDILSATKTASSFLHEQELLSAFVGVVLKDSKGKPFTCREINSVCNYVKTELFVKNMLKEKNDGYRILMDELTALGQFTNMVYGVMANAYKEAIILYNKTEAEYKKYQPVSTESSFLDNPILQINLFTEAETSDEPQKPKSDQPIQDALHDVNRVISRKTAEAKIKTDKAIQTGRLAARPFKRAGAWIDKTIGQFRDAKKTNIIEKMTNPHDRSKLFSALRAAITAGALYKAGLLLHPIFLFLAVAGTIRNRKNLIRIRNEVTGEIKQEIEILETKIRHAEEAGDKSAVYKLMRLKNEMEKKAIRVAGDRATAKAI